MIKFSKINYATLNEIKNLLNDKHRIYDGYYTNEILNAITFLDFYTLLYHIKRYTIRKYQFNIGEFIRIACLMNLNNDFVIDILKFLIDQELFNNSESRSSYFVNNQLNKIIDAFGRLIPKLEKNDGILSQ